jgi:UDP-glucose 4-epimerase
MHLSDGARVLVTGGAGFLGSGLVRLLLARGCRVTVIDDLSNGLIENLPTSDHKSPQLAVRIGRIGQADAEALLDDEVSRSDAVFHLASPIGVLRAHSERLRMTRSILTTGIAVVEACRRHRRPMLFTSSSEVYGSGRLEPISEDESVTIDLRPRWGYAASKAAVEHLVAGLFHEEGIPAWIVRPFNMSGPRQRPVTGQVVPVFADAALRGAPIVVHDDGQQRRSFLHVDDAANGLVRIAECESLCGRAVNLGGTEAVSIAHLAELVRQSAGRPVQIVSMPSEAVFGKDFAVTRDRVPDTRLLQESTGWYPQRSVLDIVTDCVDHLRRQRAVA